MSRYRDIAGRAVRTLAESRIQAAMEAEEIDGLEGAGRPLTSLGEPYEPDWWIKKWLYRERLCREVGWAWRELREGRGR